MTALLHEVPAPGRIDMMRWRRTFAGRPDEARSVRRFVAFLLDDHPRTDDAVYVTAELAANAMRHTRSGQAGGRFVVEVRRWQCGSVAIAVTDEGTTTDPRPRDPDELAESGRGLRSVATLASHWCWTGDNSGRTVMAIFDEC